MNRLLSHALLYFWFSFLLVILILGINPELENSAAAIFALVVFALGLTSICSVYPTGLWSPPSLFFIVMGIFHLGLTPFWIFKITPELGLSYDSQWFNGQTASVSLQIVAFSLISFVVGSLLILSIKSNSPRNVTTPNFNQPEFLQFQKYGSLILFTAVLLWFFFSFRSGGLAIFFSSYRNFLALTSNAPLTYIYLFIGLGLGLALIRPLDNLQSKFAVASFLVFAFIAFFIGLRGEVLFPSVAGLSVMAFSRKMPNFLASTILFIVALAIINTAKEIRRVGISSAGFSWAEARPLSALEELGSTIRVVAMTVNWHFYSGEPLRHGDTYTVFLARTWELLTDPAGRLPATEDFRLMHIEVANRASNIGGSIIGEAFHNFGVYGSVIILIVFGIIIGYFGIRHDSSVVIATYIVFAIPLFNHIRNSFVPVIPFIVFGLLLVLFLNRLHSTSHEARFHNKLVADLKQDGA